MGIYPRLSQERLEGSTSSITLFSFFPLSQTVLPGKKSPKRESGAEAARVTSRMVPPQEQPIEEGSAAAVPLT